MIGSILDELRKKIDEINKTEDGKPSTLFPKFNLEKLDLEVNAITLILVNIEEERIFKNPDPYRRRQNFQDPNGPVMEVNPPVSLSLYILFAGSYNDYKQSWNKLAGIITYFQKERMINLVVENKLYTLQMELISQTFSQQNELWSTLKSPQTPSVLYRANLLVIEDLDEKSTIEVKELRFKYCQNADQKLESHSTEKQEKTFVIRESSSEKLFNSG
jgi:hypothetical protein